MGFLYRKKLIRYPLLAIVLLVLVVPGGGGWYFASVLHEDGLRVDHGEPEPRVTVTEIGDGTISLKQIPGAKEAKNLRLSATWGLTDGEIYGQLGTVISESDGRVTREHAPMVGEFSVGQNVYLERTAYPHDPLSAHGLDYREVMIPGPIGNLGAWHVPANSDTWAVLVHGRTSSRETSLKLLDDLADLGINSLTIDYRNDEGAPPSESGYYDFGVTEWEDVEAAVRYALENGAEKIVLVGYSMGGGIVVNYQLRSSLADRTVGMVLDAPMLNFGRTVDKGAEERSVPSPITATAKLFSTFRFGIDWRALDFLSHADDLTVPVLLIHSDIDDTVPIETSQEFARLAPELVEMHTFKDVDHVASWNSYTDEYEALFRDFLQRIR